MEREPQTQLTLAQETALRGLCRSYGVEFDESHYYVNGPSSISLPGYAEGWLGGMRHANPQYATPEEPAGKPTIYVGVSPEGRVSS